MYLHRQLARFVGYAQNINQAAVIIQVLVLLLLVRPAVGEINFLMEEYYVQLL
ncbi:hypothetical protein [Bacillus canaveralius]|uniref:hypothetical protein n=1 Tax=Bacillus canaveralius TaxID=1403243 RepID=UPI00163B1091|nr:hypothetical protein [Bacillus canaveralius]